MRRSLVCWLILTLHLPALATEWGDFGPAFPETPCQDGWSACVVDGQAVTPDLLRADTVPTPADLRVSWFSLEPTATFSPFVELSGYAPGETAKPEPEPETKVDPRPAPIASRPRPESPNPAPVPAPEPEEEQAVASLDELVRMEPRAVLGRLSDQEMAEIEALYRTAPKQTDRDRASRTLIRNAWGRGDRDAWERLVQRHLDEVSRSDPDLCLAFAAYQQEHGRHETAITWAVAAEENKDRWEGATFVSRNSQILRIKARSSYRRWERAEQELVAGTGDREAVEELRGRAKVFTREYVDYLRSAGKSTETALGWCRSVAGHAYCE